MASQATSTPWPGGAPGQREPLPELLASFEHGGAQAEAAPSAALAVALEAVAGPDGQYEGADTDALVGIVRQWAAIESWAAAGLLSALRAMTREDGEGTPLLRRRGDLPDGWTDSLNYEVAAALAMGPVSAGNLAGLAWTLGTRLPGIGRLLADGTLTRAKAKLVAATFEPLSDSEAARAQALILSELAGKTYFQVERLAWRAALAVAPDVAERRRSAAERDRARVTVFREESGAVGLSGRDLPAAQALSGHARVLARARQYESSGAFPSQTASRLQALAYLHLLNGVTAEDAIAFVRVEANGGESDADPGDDGGPGGPRGPEDPEAPPSTPPVLPEVTVPLVTLERRAERPGDNRLLGPLDPAMTRELAAAAARSPYSRWEVTVVDDNGYAIGHGVARAGRTEPRPGQDSCALPARVNITVTETFLHQLATPPRSGAPPPGDWQLTLKSPDDEYGTWTLTLPGGRQLTVRFDVVPTHACDHRHQVSTYAPTDRLRRLIQIRDHECTFPPCSRPACESDFEHAVPYDQGGPTDACNAGARSRRCHQVKQSKGWKVTQPRPGWHQWTTPTGRTYIQEPWRYIA